MKYENEITVILTVWRRNHFAEQLEALLNQTKKPLEIWVQHKENHVDINDILNKYNDQIKYIRLEANKGVYERFEIVPEVTTEYVFIIDDDIIPGHDFLKLALQKSKEYNSLICPNGRILNPYSNVPMKYIGDGYLFEFGFCLNDTQVDFGNNAWFFKAEWIDYFFKYKPLFLNNGEDIQLSASLKLFGNIDTFVPKQIIPYEAGNTRRSYSFDEYALHKRANFLEERCRAVKRYRDDGWKLQAEKSISQHIIEKNYTEKNVLPISVVMSNMSYNDDTRKSILSIIQQSFKDFELIIVANDNDNCYSNLIKEITDERIKFIDTKCLIDKYDGLNIACGISQGTYICIADGDYISDQDRLKIQYNYMETHPENVASGALCRFTVENGVTDNELTYEEALLSLMYGNSFIESSMILRSFALKRIGYFRQYDGIDASYFTMINLAVRGVVTNLSKILVATDKAFKTMEPTILKPLYQKILFARLKQIRKDITHSTVEQMFQKLAERL